MVKAQLSLRLSVLLFLLISSFAVISACAGDDPSPEQKAFKEARDTKDPQKKVEALQKFIQDHPYSSNADDAREMVLDTLIKKLPDRKQDIAAQCEVSIESASYWEKTSI
ncbi:MAG TPA: hypothetical protein VI756_26755, partial [Blastocatellia bacterium]